MHGTSSANIASAKLFYSKINLSRAVDSGPRIGWSFAANAVQVSLSIARRYVSRVDEGK